MMKRLPILILAIALLLAGWFAYRQSWERQSAAPDWETVPLARGDLTVTVSADGSVRANQTALLLWGTTGTVETVNVQAGDRVTAGQVLAALKQDSLPQPLILAQAELAAAQRALDELLLSQAAEAQARLAVEQAQKTLDDARDPVAAQAAALSALANARRLEEDARRALAILESPPSEEAVEAARGSLLLAENVLNRTLENIERTERRLKKPESQYMFFESRDLYRSLLKNLEIKRARDQRAYEDALSRYNRSLAPPDETELSVARANLAAARAQLGQAQRDWERIEAGPSPTDLGVLEAQLADAQREWERVKDGPTEGDRAAAEARIAAAQAALNLQRLTAPFDGVITRVAAQPGDQVRIGVGVEEAGAAAGAAVPLEPANLAFRLDDLSRLVVDVQVAEVEINRLQVGQPAELTFDALPGKVYAGRVSAVPQVGEELLGGVVFITQVELTEPDEDVRPGMTCTVKIITRKLEDVLLVPNEAVRFVEGGRRVYILRGGQPVPVDVTLGMPGEAYSPLVGGGIQPGDLIVLNPPAG